MPKGIYQRTDEQLVKLRLRMSGNKNPAKRTKIRKKISLALKGHLVSENTKLKISKTKEKLFKEGKLQGPNKGKKFSRKHRLNIGKSRKGKFIGEKSGRWKGGKILHEGYYYIYNKGKNVGYIKRADLVWFENTGEIIKYPYRLHHINGIKTDDRFENLQKLTQSEHAKITKKGRDINGKFQRI